MPLLLFSFNPDHTTACTGVCVCIHIFTNTRHSTDSSVFPGISSVVSLIEDSRTQSALQLDRALLFITPHKITEKVWPWFSSDWQPNTHFLSHTVTELLCMALFLTDEPQALHYKLCRSHTGPKLWGWSSPSSHTKPSTHCPADIKQTCIHTIHFILTFIFIIIYIEIYSVKLSPCHSLTMGRIQTGGLQYVSILHGKLCVFRDICILYFKWSVPEWLQAHIGKLCKHSFSNPRAHWKVSCMTV